MLRAPLAVAGLLVALVGCSERTAPHAVPPDGPSASSPAFTRDPAANSAAATASATADPETAAADGGAVADGGDTDNDEAAADPAEEPASDTATNEPLPEVDITAHGMHIGGGPNDAATKTPIRNAVLAQRDTFRACFARVAEPTKTGTFGVDVRIPREGGAAEVTKPRPGLKGEGVSDCMVRAFEGVQFAKPPKGAPMVVSISLRFVPKAKP